MVRSRDFSIRESLANLLYFVCASEPESRMIEELALMVLVDHRRQQLNWKKVARKLTLR